jgi:hypothetical protein
MMQKLKGFRANQWFGHVAHYDKNMRITCLITTAALVWFASLLSGCQAQDSFTRHHHTGNVYEVVGNLCIVEDLLKDEQMETLEGWQKHAEKFHKHFEKLQPGTKIQIASIEKHTQSSWNTGRYSYYVVRVNVLAPGHEGTRYNASHLMYGEHGTRFGDNGSNLVTLKLVSGQK